jgi:hypothetical protein
VLCSLNQELHLTWQHSSTLWLRFIRLLSWNMASRRDSRLVVFQLLLCAANVLTSCSAQDSDGSQTPLYPPAPELEQYVKVCTTAAWCDTLYRPAHERPHLRIESVQFVRSSWLYAEDAAVASSRDMQQRVIAKKVAVAHRWHRLLPAVPPRGTRMASRSPREYSIWMPAQLSIAHIFSFAFTNRWLSKCIFRQFGSRVAHQSLRVPKGAS